MDHAESTDDRSRLHLPADVSERFRIVELPTHVALFPVDDDWLRGPALDAVEEHDDLVTSILAFAGVLVLLFNQNYLSLRTRFVIYE